MIKLSYFVVDFDESDACSDNFVIEGMLDESSFNLIHYFFSNAKGQVIFSNALMND